MPASPNGRTRSEILREAIDNAGGPAGDDLASIKNFVDANYPDFDWRDDCWGEIAGAKQAERSRLRIAPVDELEPESPVTVSAAALPKVVSEPTVTAIGISQIASARDFIASATDGCVDRARRVLQCVLSLESGSLAQLDEAIGVWADLLAAVDGDPDRADRVLDLIAQKFQSPAPTIRLATAA